MKVFICSKATLAFSVFSLYFVVSCGSPATDTAGVTSPDSITIYESDASYNPATIPNRADSTTECENTHQNNPSWGVSCSNYVALLAFDTDNGVQNLPTNFNVPTSLAVFTPDAVEVAENYADLIDDRDVVMVGDGFGIDSAWSGFQGGGSVLANCNNYTSTSNSDNMSRAQLNFTGSWATGSVPCDSSLSMPVLCLCW